MVADVFELKQLLRFIGWQLEQGRLDLTQIQDLQRACTPLHGQHLAIFLLAATIPDTEEAVDEGTGIDATAAIFYVISFFFSVFLQ